MLLATPPARKVRRPASTPVATNPGRQHEQDEKNVPPDAMNVIAASPWRLYRALAGFLPAAPV
jgi:hypothetical protein